MANPFANRIVGYIVKKASELAANPLNWRKHPQRQRDAVQASLRELGWVAAVVENVRTGYLIDGHERVWQAMQNDEDVPVLQVDLSEDEEKLALAVFDPIGALAEADADALDALLRDVQTGEAALQELLAELAEDAGLYPDSPQAVDADPQIDRTEELRQKWGVESGQLWQLGDHRLICGDCTDADVVARLMSGEKAQLMVTDPPYGVEYDANWRNEAAEKGLLAYAARRIGKVENDDRADWADAWKLFEGDVVYCWHADRRASTVQQSLESVGFELRAQIIWRKSNFAISRGHYTYQHEPCWYAVRKGKTAHWIGPANASTVWEISLDKNTEGGHSTQKPLQCMARPIEYHDCSIVYDPFLGSGTTIIACENLGRKCRAVEISAGYVAVALQRWADATGREPVLLEGADA